MKYGKKKSSGDDIITNERKLDTVFYQNNKLTRIYQFLESIGDTRQADMLKDTKGWMRKIQSTTKTKASRRKFQVLPQINYKKIKKGKSENP